MNELTKEEVNTISTNLAAIKLNSPKVGTALGNAGTILKTVEDRGGTWATPIKEEMNTHQAQVTIIEEKTKTSWEPEILTHIPAGMGLTTSQKTYCRGRVTYMKGHLDKLDYSATNAPIVLSESQKVRVGLEALDAVIVADPITSPSGRPLGLARYHRRR